MVRVMSNEALQRACDAVGGQSKLARRLGTTQSQIWYWLNDSKRGVPAEFVLSIEKETGIPRHKLRPDLWSPPDDGQNPTGAAP